MIAAGGGWTLRYNRKAEKDLARVDPPVARRILLALGDRADDLTDPARSASALVVPSRGCESATGA